MFGPVIMLTWFVVLGGHGAVQHIAAGSRQILARPQSSLHAAQFVA